MAEYSMAAVTVPTPEPYDDKDPTQQLENVCYVLLQMLSLAKNAGFTVQDSQSATMNVNLEGVEQRLDALAWNSIQLDLWPLGRIVLTNQGLGTREP